MPHRRGARCSDPPDEVPVEKEEEYLHIYRLVLWGLIAVWFILFKIMYRGMSLRGNWSLWIPLVWVPVVLGTQLYGISTSAQFAKRLTDKRMLPVLHEESQNIASSIFSVVALLQTAKQLGGGTQASDTRHVRHLMLGLMLLICVASPVIYVPSYTPMAAVVRGVQQGALHYALAIIAATILDVQRRFPST